MSMILIIDDDPDFVNATRIVLEKEGYKVERAAGGKEGFQKALKSSPDLVILDVMMDSVLDGISVSRKMNEDDATRDIDAFLSKPINPEKMIKKIRRILS